MSDLVQPVILGIVEGLTEFLPVSSTGHLILATKLLGYDPEKWGMFNVVIQLGAILAVVVAYWRTFVAVAAGVLRRDPAAIRFVRNVVVGFLPAAIVGLALHKKIEALLGRADVVAVALIVGGVAILIIERFARRGEIVGIAHLPLVRSIGIGCLQCLAMIPGVSRSGATIMGALALGVERRTAAEYSFFLAIPTMLGATVVELARNHHSIGQAGGVTPLQIAIGLIVSFVVALGVIRAMVAFVSRHGFAPFAWYRIAAGIVALIALGGV